MWSELPNYNPIGVSTSNAGQNFADQAAVLFRGCVDNNASSGVEDAEFIYNETTSHQQSEGPANIEDENDCQGFLYFSIFISHFSLLYLCRYLICPLSLIIF